MFQEVDVIHEVERVLRIESKAIEDCAERISRDPSAAAVRGAVELLQKALNNGGKIVVTGVGKSGKIGEKIAATLASTGSISIFVHPTDSLHGDLGLIMPQDAVLALSYTGNTDELLHMIPSLKARKVPIIGIGGNPHSKLAQDCDVWLDGSVAQEACPHNLAPTTSTTLALVLGDALAISLMRLRGFDPDSFAKNHPGGSLGRRLSLKVADIMHKGSAVGTVTQSTSMDEVLSLITEKGLGAVLVVEGRKLVGIITDGDVRRALKHRERFFQMNASDIMTQSPVTVFPDQMAFEALELMENRPMQIKELPVVDSEKNWIGLVRVHDLVRVF